MSSVNDIVLNAYYEAPDGRIALTLRSSHQTGLVQYRFDDDEGPRTLPMTEFVAWKRREDLTDFPDARDPRLPYEFDLCWDLKRRSQLVGFLKTAEDDDCPYDLRKAMAKHGIVLTPEQEAEIEDCRLIDSDGEDDEPAPGLGR